MCAFRGLRNVTLGAHATGDAETEGRFDRPTSIASRIPTCATIRSPDIPSARVPE
jgi:hypothetical protein